MLLDHLFYLLLHFIYCVLRCCYFFFFKTNKYKYNNLTNAASIYLLKTKQYKHQNKVWSIPKVDNKDTRTTLTAVVLMSSLSTPNPSHTSHQHPHRRLSMCKCWLGINKKQLPLYTQLQLGKIKTTVISNTVLPNPTFMYKHFERALIFCHYLWNSFFFLSLDLFFVL